MEDIIHEFTKNIHLRNRNKTDLHYAFIFDSNKNKKWCLLWN
jgi:hypothetical protein